MFSGSPWPLSIVRWTSVPVCQGRDWQTCANLALIKRHPYPRAMWTKGGALLPVLSTTYDHTGLYRMLGQQRRDLLRKREARERQGLPGRPQAWPRGLFPAHKTQMRAKGVTQGWSTCLACTRPWGPSPAQGKRKKKKKNTPPEHYC
jgi:hypothetical protein